MTTFSASANIFSLYNGPVKIGADSNTERRLIIMLAALGATLGVLLGIIIFFIILGVGVVEIIRAIVNSFKK